MNIPRLLAALLLPVLLAVTPAAYAGSARPAPDSYVAAVAAAWAEGPVYVSPDSGALTDAQAAALADRIDGWRDDVHVAVLPAVALTGSDGSPLGDATAASDLLDELHARLDEDGIFVVNLSGRGTYGAGYGSADGAREVGDIVAQQVDDHTLGQVDATLNGVLDGLGAPGGGFPWLWLALGAALVAVGVAGLLWSRRSRRRVLASGEVWAGPADYRPAFAFSPDDDDTLAQRAALAREDVIRLGEEIDRADLPVADPAVAAHVQAALDAYADASRRVGAFAEDGDPTSDPELRKLGEITEYARWQLGCARAALAADPPPERRVPCFLDAGHGASVADWTWAPPGGVERPVPVCRSCLDHLSGARA